MSILPWGGLRFSGIDGGNLLFCNCLCTSRKSMAGRVERSGPVRRRIQAVEERSSLQPSWGRETGRLLAPLPLFPFPTQTAWFCCFEADRFCVSAGGCLKEAETQNLSASKQQNQAVCVGKGKRGRGARSRPDWECKLRRLCDLKFDFEIF